MPQQSGVAPAAQIVLGPQQIQEIVNAESQSMAQRYAPKTTAQRDELQRIIYNQLRNVNPGQSSLTVAGLDAAMTAM